MVTQTIQMVTGKYLNGSFTDMLKGMKVKRPHVRQVFPYGNLSALLIKLRCAPFELMETCNGSFDF